MTKKILITISLFLIIIVATLTVIALVNSQNKSEEPTPISYVDANKTTLINYTHSSGDYSFTYPTTWEFLPERQELGMRPKAYCCTEFNEIVTILYFDLKGQDFETLTSEFDGVSSANWEEFTTANGEKGYRYNHSSDKLKYVTNWFHNGEHALKMMFRSKDINAPDGNIDNTEYFQDFQSILNSLKFN